MRQTEHLLVAGLLQQGRAHWDILNANILIE
jgi:hypothetical protein